MQAGVERSIGEAVERNAATAAEAKSSFYSAATETTKQLAQLTRNEKAREETELKKKEQELRGQKKTDEEIASDQGVKDLKEKIKQLEEKAARQDAEAAKQQKTPKRKQKERQDTRPENAEHKRVRGRRRRRMRYTERGSNRQKRYPSPRQASKVGIVKFRYSAERPHQCQ
ncbi:hypothetical protein B0H63DRAFT_140956 [Podospora didyma]|uniref:Uncharacterized protein n=1 Tax=Podospora didyma TaxID=330526 RepID=A0AAE0NSC1_9PEZI|nr:hypothetical protein B0H63DRAFT_140956 [Podospora didyma]